MSSYDILDDSDDYFGARAAAAAAAVGAPAAPATSAAAATTKHYHKVINHYYNNGEMPVSMATLPRNLARNDENVKSIGVQTDDLRTESEHVIHEELRNIKVEKVEKQERASEDVVEGEINTEMDDTLTVLPSIPPPRPFFKKRAAQRLSRETEDSDWLSSTTVTSSSEADLSEESDGEMII